MKTQKQWKKDLSGRTLEGRLAKATAIYIQQLSERSSKSLTDRYSAYMLINGALEVIWPDFEYLHHGEAPGVCSTESRAIPAQMNGLNMSYSSRREYPAYHFIQKGYGYSKTAEILNTICEYAGRRIPGFMLTGHNPSPISQLSSRILDQKETHV